MEHSRVLSSLVVAGALLGVPAGASAGSQHAEWADVVDVVPVTHSVRVETPRRECWTEEVVRPRHRSRTPEILGAIIGGAIGNQFGSGSAGRGAATLAGALLGGSIAHDAHGSGYSGGYTDSLERCRTVSDYHTEDRVAGYRVTYVYGGRTYTTRMNRDPGDRVRVRVAVTPEG